MKPVGGVSAAELVPLALDVPPVPVVPTWMKITSPTATPAGLATDIDVTGVVGNAVWVVATVVTATVGVTELDAAEAVPVPMALMAETVKVYVVPLVRPVAVKLVDVDPVFWGVWALAPI